MLRIKSISSKYVFNVHGPSRYCITYGTDVNKWRKLSYSIWKRQFMYLYYEVFSNALSDGQSGGGEPSVLRSEGLNTTGEVTWTLKVQTDTDTCQTRLTTRPAPRFLPAS